MATTPTYKELLNAGVHFGHLKRKWNPKMRPHIFMERKGIHIIDLNSTITSMEQAGRSVKAIAKSGRKVMFVATKKQAQEVVKKAAQRVNMPFVVDRWLGGMMTNFATIRRSVRKMQRIEQMLKEGGGAENLTKKERLTLTRELEKMQRVFGGIANLNSPPAAVFVVDIGHEHIAIAEAKKLNIRTYGMVDTNGDPNSIDFAIPSNDDANRSIEIVINYIADMVQEGLEERKEAKQAKQGNKEAQNA